MRICIGRFKFLLDAQICASNKNSNWPSFFYVAAHTILSGKISNPIRSNLNSLNTDGSLTMANLNSFLGPFEILQLAEEKNFLRKSSYSIMKLYVVCSHLNHLTEVILMCTLNIQLLCKRSKISLNYRHLLPDLAP